MRSAASLRKGWCPGALRPMPAKDGLIVRLRLRGGAVAAATLRRLAQAGRAHGNGLFELTSRGNLQFRGVRAECMPALIETLGGLGLLDDNESIEAVRNILLSPLSGLDGRNEATRAAKALETMLAESQDLHALPGKFGFLIDDGSALSLGLVPADIRFDWDAGQAAYVIGIGGRADEASFLECCAGAEIPGVASRLARAFLRLQASLRDDPPRRMHELVARCGADTVAKEAGLRLTAPSIRRAQEEPCPIGLMRCKGINFFGAGAVFGRLDAAMLGAAASASEIFGKGEIRLTPWRALILPFVSEEQAGALSAYVAERGFIVDREDARLAVAACGGETTCEHGTTDARSGALALMFLARSLCKTGVALHVSGCAKGCARQAASPLTLIARDGRYDLVTDQAARNAGIEDAQGLGLGEVHDMFETIARKGERHSGSGQQ